MFDLYICSFVPLCRLQSAVLVKASVGPATRIPTKWSVVIVDRGSNSIKADQEVMGPPGGLNTQRARLWGKLGVRARALDQSR